jgi:hypothetical protein
MENIAMSKSKSTRTALRKPAIICRLNAAMAIVTLTRQRLQDLVNGVQPETDSEANAPIPHAVSDPWLALEIAERELKGIRDDLEQIKEQSP